MWLQRITLVSICVGLVSLAAATLAHATTLGPYSGVPIALPNQGNGIPYPAGFTLGSAGGRLTGMTVQVNVSHTFPRDIDMALVSPRGQAVMLMSDNCLSQDLTNMSFTFSDAAAGELPETSTCGAGTYKPSNFDTGSPDVFPAPGPASTSKSLSVFNGSDPTGFWRLFALDAAPSDSGAINSWSITFEVSPAEIKIPGFDTVGIADPYPSTKTFTLPPGQVISDLALKLEGFGHHIPEDVDMLLADDQGGSVVVASDACGPNQLFDLDWTISDAGPVTLGDGTDSGCESTGVFPTDHGTPDSPDEWPAPAPSPTSHSMVDAFAGHTGGPFSLFAVDDKTDGFGYINGWDLELTTRTAVATGFNSQLVGVTEGETGMVSIGRDGPHPRGPGEVTLSAVSGSAVAGKDFRVPTQTIDLDPNLLEARLPIPIIDDGTAEKSESFLLVLSSPQGDASIPDESRSVKVTIPASKNATLKLGKLKLNRRKGTGTLAAKVSSPGRVSVSGKGLKKVTVTMKQPGKLKLNLKAAGRTAKSLRRTGKAKLKAKVTYKTLGDRKVTRQRAVVLKR